MFVFFTCKHFLNTYRKRTSITDKTNDFTQPAYRSALNVGQLDDRRQRRSGGGNRTAQIQLAYLFATAPYCAANTYIYGGLQRCKSNQKFFAAGQSFLTVLYQTPTYIRVKYGEKIYIHVCIQVRTHTYISKYSYYLNWYTLKS